MEELMSRKQRTILISCGIVLVLAATAFWACRDVITRYRFRHAIAAAAPQTPATPAVSTYPTLPLESALMQTPAQPLTAFPLAERRWGERFNPGGEVPRRGFHVWFFDSRDPAQAVIEKDSERISINYGFPQYPEIPLSDLGAYWAGTLHVPHKGRYVFLPDVQQGRARILLDKRVLLTNASPNDTPAPAVVELEAGDYRLEAEYLNFQPIEAHFRLDVLANPAIFDSAGLKALIATLKLPENTEAYVSAVYGAVDDDNRVTLQAPPGKAPYVLWLASEHAVNWQIKGRQPLLVIHNARSSVAANLPALIWTGAFGSHSQHWPPCKCRAGLWQCNADAATNPIALAAEIQRISGLPLRDFRSGQRVAELAFLGHTDVASDPLAAHAALQEQQAAERQTCQAENSAVSRQPFAYDRDIPSLAAYPLASDGWGEQINPNDAVPASDFALFYRDRAAPTQIVIQENPFKIGFEYYIESQPYGIPAERLDAYWTGRQHIAAAGYYRLRLNSSHAEVRVLLNKHILADSQSLHNIDSAPPFYLEAGDYLLEVEYRSQSEDPHFKLEFVRDEKALDSNDLAAAIAAKNLPPNTVAYAVGVNQKNGRGYGGANQITLRIAPSKPYILFLGNHRPLNWRIDSAGEPPRLVIASGDSSVSDSVGLMDLNKDTLLRVGEGGNILLRWNVPLDAKLANEAPYACDCYSSGLACPYNRTNSLRNTVRLIEQVSGVPLVGVSSEEREDIINVPQKEINRDSLAADDDAQEQLRQLRKNCDARRQGSFDALLSP